MRRAWLLVTLMVGLIGVTPAHAGSDDALLKLLIRKGILTQEDVDALKREMAAEEAAQKAAPPAVPAMPATTAAPAAPAAAGQAPVTEAQLNEVVGQVRNEILTEMAEKDEAAISISVTLEGEVRWRRYGNLGDRNSGSTSDIFLRDAEVDLEFRPTDYITGKLVLKSEYFGSDTTDGGAEADSAVVVDEATITFEQEDGFPLYGALGKRTQPFGAFYGHLVTDTPSKDAYEANQVGATLGYKDKAWWGLDVSFTAYRQEELMDHFFGSTLFDNTTIVRASSVGLADSSDNIQSFIGAVNITPLPDLALGGGISSEPGAGRRNQTAGFWGSYTWGPLTAETEFYIALTREDYVRQTETTDPATGETTTTPVRLGRSFKEKQLTFGLYYRPIEKLELGVRYTRFWDDGLATTTGVWSVRDRISLGAGWIFYEKGDISVGVSGEYRYSDLERGGAARQTAVSDQHELFGKVSVTYK
jgi:hypothetical protein